METDIHDHRFQAALASKGISSGAIYQMALEQLGNDCENHAILEFGAGTGNLIGLIRQAGHRGTLVGADILPRPETLPSDIQWIQADLNDPLQYSGESFDWIISTEVIEHLENPRAVFRELHRLLRPNGKLVMTTPNQESFRSLASIAMAGHFVGFLDSCYPAHITALLRKDFIRICGETGFRPPEFFYTNYGGIPKCLRFTWQQISFGLLKGRLFSDNIAVCTSKVS